MGSRFPVVLLSIGLAVSLPGLGFAKGGIGSDPECRQHDAPVGECSETPFEAVLPTGKIVTPQAAPGSMFVPLDTELRSDGNANVGGAVSTALSPDGKIL